MGAVPADLLITFAWTRVLKMRSNVLFWLCLVPLFLFVLIRNEVGLGARLAALLVWSWLVPFALSVDRPSRKLLVIALVNVIVIVSEAVAIAAWYLMTGLDVLDYSATWGNLGAFAHTHVMHLVALAFLFWGLSKTLDRFDRNESGVWGGFVWFPVAQAAMLVLAFTAGILLHRGSSILYYGLSALALVCFAADVLLFASEGRYARKQREDQRASLLQHQLEGYLEQCGAFAAETERMAQLRHDIRNQVQVTVALAECGEFDRARDHLAAFRASL